jgi:hypothetical protein
VSSTTIFAYSIIESSTVSAGILANKWQRLFVRTISTVLVAAASAESEKVNTESSGPIPIVLSTGMYWIKNTNQAIGSEVALVERGSFPTIVAHTIVNIRVEASIIAS